MVLPRRLRLQRFNVGVGTAIHLHCHFLTLVENMIDLALYGFPDSNTQAGMILCLGFPMLGFRVVKTFYAVKAKKSKRKMLE